MPRSRRLLLTLSAGLLVLSLGLPWTSARAGWLSPGWYTPGSCITRYDYNGYSSLDCSTGWYTPGWYYAGTRALPGYATDIRVWALAAVVLVVLALRHSSRRLLLIGLAVAAFGWLQQRGSLPGQLAYLAAVLCLVATVRTGPARAGGGAGRSVHPG